MSIYQNIKVLDLTRVLSGPSCTQFFSDGGATVYKIEPPETGDYARQFHPFSDDESVFFAAYNRGKKSVTVDFSKPEGAELIKQLAKECDVVVENFKPGSLKKYGLDYESLKSVNEKIVYCSITGYGQDGPKSHLPAYDFVIQAISGLMSITGETDGTPMRSGVTIIDHIAGLHATIAIVSALHHRTHTGEGQYIDIGMLDSALSIYGHNALSYAATGISPGLTGNTNNSISPSDLFQCKDSPITIMVGTDDQFKSLCKIIERTDLIGDPLYTGNKNRVTNNQSLYQELSREFIKYHRDTLIEKFESVGIACGSVNTAKEVFEHPQVIHRNILGRNGTVASPLRFSKTPMQSGVIPKLGEHTEQVLGELSVNLSELKSKGII